MYNKKNNKIGITLNYVGDLYIAFEDFFIIIF